MAETQRPQPLRQWGFTLLGLALMGGSVVSGQEEEETRTKKPLKKIVVDDDAPGMGNPGLTQPDLVRAANSTTNPALKAFFSDLATPADRLTDRAGTVTRIRPVPLLWGRDKYPEPFGIIPLDASNAAGEVVSMTLAGTRKIEPYEQLAMIAVDQLVNPPKSVKLETLPPVSERLAAAERVLAQVLFFHETAIEQRQRVGKSWEPIKKAVDEKLTAIRVQWVIQSASEREWTRVRDLTARFQIRYRGQPKVLIQMEAQKLREAEELLDSEKLADLERVRSLVSDFESRFPGETHDLHKKIRSSLTAKAKKFLDQAERLSASNPSEARNILRTVEALDPDQAGLNQLQQQLKAGYAVLVVGTRQPPERMSPATARFDSEKQIVELLFEGLLDAEPDDQLGVNYRRSLCTGKPQSAALARTVALVNTAAWTNPEAGRFDSADLVGTLKLLRDQRTLPSADRIDWFDEPGLDPSDANLVKIRFKTGHPDPRELLTIKMLPARWLESQKKSIVDDSFAVRPFGTGPFRLSPNSKPNEPGRLPVDVVLVANSQYARRPGRIAQPAIKEIRMRPLSTVADPVAELRNERIHIIPDIPTRELEKYAAQTQAVVVTPAVNRRIHLLAVNHRVPSLQNLEIRKGLNLAIDRESILNEVYRAGRKEFHKALAGPFPADSWLTPQVKGGQSTLYSRDAAAAKLAPVRGGKPLALLYPNDDPLAKEACERIKKQWEDAAKGESGTISVTLESVTPQELHHRVYQEQRYDLALISQAYSSDWSIHELATWLDSTAADAGGRNCFGYGVKATNPTAADDQFRKALAESISSRDPERIQTLSGEVVRRFNEVVPFIPLWQIDAHMAVSTKLKIYFDGHSEPALPRMLNPTTLFASVGRWRLE